MAPSVDVNGYRSLARSTCELPLLYYHKRYDVKRFTILFANNRGQTAYAAGS